MRTPSLKQSFWRAHARPSIKRVLVGILGSRLISETVRRSMSPSLRVLAYHGVSDSATFEAQLDDLLTKYSPINGSGIIEHLDAGENLPPNAIWITFDDGAASVVENATPVLLERGLSATMFVCPGVIEGELRQWWETVALAVRVGWEPADGPSDTIVQNLKSVPDADRRRVIRSAEDFLQRVPELERLDFASVAGRGQLRTWMSAGMELGNHTWDHPCLDACSPDEQRRQIVEADRWLATFGAFDRVKLFAYPNGDWTAESESVLRDLGYQAGLLFDHQINRLPKVDLLRASRLRIDASAGVGRSRAVVSGAHSLVYRPSDPATGQTHGATW